MAIQSYSALDLEQFVAGDSEILALFKQFDDFPIDRTTIPQEYLDLTNRSRTSLFPWRGQFSPELVELFLTEYTESSDTVADPFVGSGTTLFESARKKLPCVGAEINPAAVVMASTVLFANCDADTRRDCFRKAQEIIEQLVPLSYAGSLFSWNTGQAPISQPSLGDSLKAILNKSSYDPLVRTIISNTILKFMASEEQKGLEGLFQALKEYKAIVEQVPYSDSLCRVFHCDARALPIDTSSVDFIITSPPYINVFNYHQNYRPVMELMGWDMLRIARSEFGSNRKNRGNRFLTVVQYAIDMFDALAEMRRMIKLSGRIVVVVGRESAVRQISFANGRIVAALAVGGAYLRLIKRQERKFKTKFGETIYEDILHFVPTTSVVARSHKLAWRVALYALREALDKAENGVVEDIESAIDNAWNVQGSPYFIHSASELR